MIQTIAMPDPRSLEWMFRKQKLAYSDGTALANHTQSAHGGKFCEECAACRELREKGQA